MLKIVFAALIALGLAAGAAPANAAKTPAEQQFQRACINIYNYLPRIVPRAAVAAIGRNVQVVIHPICQGVDLIDFGNAAGLGHTIAANSTLSAALARAGWRPDDVTAISIHGATVDLYVHEE